MFSVQLNVRCKKILKILMSNSGYTDLQTIADKTKVSKRSIYYDICKINEWLEQYGVEELEIERNKGILLPPDRNQKIQDLMNEGLSNEGYVFLPTERVKVIITYIIYSNTPVHVQQLMECCQVSRNTVFSDLRIAVNQLHKYDLNLEYESKLGYVVYGNSIRIRALFFYYFNELIMLFNNGILKFYNRQEIRGYFYKLKLIEKELCVDYVDGNLMGLAALLCIMYRGRADLSFPDVKKEEIYRTKEYQLVEKYFEDVMVKEKLYLCLHLLGSRVSFISEDVFENRANQSVYEVTKALVTEFEKIACVDFENREELERALFVHINTSLYRYQYGIQMGNPMGTDIIREYPNLFEITRVVVKYLEQMIGMPITDGEVAYLALHFGAYLKISKPAAEQLRVLIVCVNGISTGNMLKREVRNLLPEAKIVDVVAIMDVVNVQDICDIVISTVKVSSLVPNIVVHPILTDEDREIIMNYKPATRKQKKHLEKSIFDVVKKYVREEEHIHLKQDIVECMQGETEKLSVPLLEKENGLIECMNTDKIQISEELMGWQESIRFAGQCLIDYKSVEPKYIDTMITQTSYYGPYMFLNDDVMLAHAKPQDGVRRMDISMAVFKKPIPFQQSRKARLIFVLAAEDQEKHLRILNDIIKTVGNKEYIERLTMAEDSKEVLEFLRKIV